MAIAVTNETSHVRVIERMETSPGGRRLNKGGRLPQTIFTTLSTVAAVPLDTPIAKNLSRNHQDFLGVSLLLWNLITRF
jgi:hypothetical protein